MNHGIVSLITHINRHMTRWISRKTPSPLKKGEIQLWQANLSHHKPYLDKYVSLLNQAELDRKNRFKFTVHQERFALSRGILRSLLAFFSGVDAKKTDFGYNPQGKPALKDQPEIQFNVSHTADSAVFAFALDEPLGVDIETISKRPTEKLAKRFFSADEARALNALPKDKRSSAFFYMWTQKEAYIKAIGLGLTQSLNQFVVSARPPSKMLSIGDSRNKAKGWAMHPFDINDKITGHLALQNHGFGVCYYLFPGFEKSDL